MSAENTPTLLRASGAAGRIVVGLSVVYAALAVRLVVETVAALFGDDFLGVLGVVLGGGILVIVLVLFILLALGHFSLGRRFLGGNPDGYPLAVAMLVVDVMHFGIYGWTGLGPQTDITWINAWIDHEASLRRQGVAYLVISGVALAGLTALILWIRRARDKPLPSIDYARTASTQSVIVALMLVNAFVANEVAQNRIVALSVRDAQADVDDQVRWRFSVPSSSPMVARGGGRAFFAGEDAELSALDEASGALMWSASISRGVQGVAYGGGTVVVSDLESVVALNAATGERRWEVGSTGEESTCVVEPAVSDGSAVYVMATRRDEGITQLQALESRSGRERWRFSWDGSNFCGRKRSVAVGRGLVLVPEAGAGDGLTALDATDGEVSWRAKLRGFPEDAAVVAGDSVYATTAGGRYVYALELGTGSVRWRRDLGLDARGPVVADNEVVIVEDRGVVALDTGAGAVVWRYRTSEDVVTPAGIDQRFVYAGTSLGTYVRLRSLERGTGRVVSCVGTAAPSDGAQTIVSRSGAIVVSRHAAIAIEPKLLSARTLKTLREYGPTDHARCPVAAAS